MRSPLAASSCRQQQQDTPSVSAPGVMQLQKGAHSLPDALAIVPTGLQTGAVQGTPALMKFLVCLQLLSMILQHHPVVSWRIHYTFSKVSFSFQSAGFNTVRKLTIVLFEARGSHPSCQGPSPTMLWYICLSLLPGTIPSPVP